MITDPLAATAVIVATAVLCQWIASRLDMPSVLFLLLAGIGLSSILDPDEIFGELMFTYVGLGVAILLFEGGTSLHWAGLQQGKAPVLRLVTIGAVLAWVVGTLAAVVFLDVETNLAVLIGAILIVSGPTVVMPLLRVVRPREPTASVLRWEGILIDPIGAGIAIVVLDAIIEDRSVPRILIRILTTFAAGLGVGAVTSIGIIAALRRRLITDHLQVAVTLAAVVVSYAVANEIRPEAGLLAVTVLGVAMANQSRAPAAHIAEFNEHLGTTVLGVLFIVLGARVDLDAVADNLGPSLAIIAVLVLVARPLTVVASTIGTGLSWPDRGFLMTLAPRGVVAAAVASLFALELEHNEVDPGPLVPVVFTVVVGTVALAGFGSRFMGQRLRVAQPKPKGVALIGGGSFSIELADQLNDLNVPTLHVGLAEEEADDAAQRGQLVYRGRLDSDQFPETVQMVGIASAIALSGTDHLDAFATERIARVIGSGNLYGLAKPDTEQEPGTSQAVAPKPVLPSGLTAERLRTSLDDGLRLRTAPYVGHAKGGERPDRTRFSASEPGWVTICRVTEGGDVIFDPGAPNGTSSGHVIELGPGLDPEEREQAGEPEPVARKGPEPATD